MYDQLTAKGLHLFLPKLDLWCRWGGLRRLARLPMFAGYVFLHHAMDKESYLQVYRTTGLVRLLGDRWDQLAVVPDGEVEAITRVLRTELPTRPHPYLREGQRVRITWGPLTKIERILVRAKPNKGLLAVSIEMLRRSVAVEVDCTAVVAA